MLNMSKFLLIAGLFMMNIQLSQQGYWFCGYSQNNLDCSESCHPAAQYPNCPGKGRSCLEDINRICK